MTKEEIAQKYVPCRCDEAYTSRGLTAPDCPYHSTDPESAMDEYAKQQSMAFSIWKEDNTCRSGEGEWQTRFDGWRKWHTIDQLYDLFIEQQQNK